MYSVTGEKSSAQYSTKNKTGTLVISLSSLLSQYQTLSQIIQSDDPPSVPSLPDVPLGYTAAPSGNLDYDRWVIEHRTWDYLYKDYMFYLDQYIEEDNIPIGGWSTSTEGPFPDGNTNVYPGKRWFRRSRLPLPSLEEWLAANYQAAYDEQGKEWKPPKPKIYQTRQWHGSTIRNELYFPGSHYAQYWEEPITAATWLSLDHIEWPVYQSAPASNPADPPSDVTPEFEDIDVEVMVRTNIFFSFFSSHFSC